MKAISILMASVLLTACIPLSNPPEDNLYQQLGGRQGLDTLVYDLLVGIAQDERIAHRFRDVNISRFKEGLETYLCDISGGPCDYTGDSMAVIHAGYGFTDVEFNALVENLVTAMENNHLPVATRNRLLALLAPSYGDIVYQ